MGEHWYDYATGKARYEMPKKGGGVRPASLADARRHRFCPSSTGILKFPFDEKHALTQHFVKESLLAVLSSPDIKVEIKGGRTIDEHVRMVLESRQEQREDSSASADWGTQLHDAVNKALTGQVYDQKWVKWVELILSNLIGSHVASEVDLASQQHGYGGRIDMVRRVAGKDVILDIKTTAKMPATERKEPYAEHCSQVASYATMWAENQKLDYLPQGYIVYVQNETGLTRQWWNDEPQIRLLEVPDMPKHFAAFKALLDYWKIRKGYDPCKT